MRSELDAILSLQRFVAGVLPEPWDIRTDLEAGAPPERPFALIEQAGAATTSGAPVAQDVVIPFTVNLYPAQQATREAATDTAFALREQMWQAVKWGLDARRPTTDRIALYCFTPRVEQHRFRLPWWLHDGPFTITVAGATTDPIEPDTDAAGVAEAIAAALTGGELNPQVGDITGQDRGTGLWDVFYGGSLAGLRIGDPTLATVSDDLYTTVPRIPLQVNDTPVTVTTTARAGLATVVLEGAPSPWRGPSDFMAVQDFSMTTVRDQSDPTLAMVAVDVRLTFARTLPVASDLRILQRVFASADSGPGG